ncbi:hypothetical protein AA671_08590 [Delftia tsuruhatensis]|uniref:hypothetical protein n=1 Tax=Delftia tsuruhatensis TaxID=180282 RepID=UPI000641C90D|nr:hypothetical protein [Delftia tsuruhatensis]KLO59603.1 hypothetical protein AA671_08590 [Delftia tsuruhatensis]
MPKAQATPYDRAAVLAFARDWAQRIVEEIGREVKPRHMVNTANTLAAILTVVAQYEEDNGEDELKLLNAVTHARKNGYAGTVGEMVLECDAVTIDVDELVSAVEEGFLDE